MEENVTADSIRETLRQSEAYNIDNMFLLLSEDFGHQRGFVFLEGEDDFNFFRDQLAPVAIGVEYYGTCGRHGIEKALQDERLQDDRVIGICDRDYSETDADRIYYCDKCCLELMVLSNAEVWAAFCEKYYPCGEEPFRAILRILRELAPISMLRRENAHENEGIRGINFRGLALGKYFDLNAHTLCMPEIFTNYGWEEHYEHCCSLAEQLTEDELYDYTNGHDICKILGLVCEDRKGTMGEQRVRNALYKSYGRENFRMTELYGSLRQYQSNFKWKYVD